ncbi:MAG: beta-lactamase family protein [Proteobacteria bacterium]|nr:beta-lactamase family protein [Pseudomonadota bacterium]
MTSEIHGFCPPQFEPVRNQLQHNLAAGLELGVRFTLAVEGQVVLDLYAGHADRAATRPFGPDTLLPVFSVTKAVAALMLARAVDRGRLDYDKPVADGWPEFAAAGKAAVTVAQALSHQAGLPGFPEPMDPQLWFEPDEIARRLAAMAPLWPPGTASGYHPISWGYLAGEMFRRADGRTLGRALSEDMAVPFGLDLHIGLPDVQHGRVAEMVRPGAMPDLGPITEPRRVAFLTKWASPSGRSSADWRRAEIPSANGHATAEALARLMAVVACDGELDGRTVLSRSAVDSLRRERITGQDLVLPFHLSWAAGLTRNDPAQRFFGPGPRSLGHYGWGGSCAFADPDRRLSGAYVMNKQSNILIGDPRAVGLIEAAYACL